MKMKLAAAKSASAGGVRGPGAWHSCACAKTRFSRVGLQGGGGGKGGGRGRGRGLGGSGDGWSGSGGGRGLGLAVCSIAAATCVVAAGAAGANQSRRGAPETGVVLESWLSWLDKLVNDCIDGKGNLDLEELERRLSSATAGGENLSRLADKLWRAIDEDEVELAESLIESVDKDKMLNFGKYAIRSICKKDERMVSEAVKGKQFWKLVQLANFGSVHQQALARSRLEVLTSSGGGGDKEQTEAIRREVKVAEMDIKTIHSVLAPYQAADVKKLVKMLKSGSGIQKVMAAQALSGLCGMGLSEKVAESLGRSPQLVKEMVSLLKQEVDAKSSAAATRSPLLSEWVEDFSLPPKVSLAGLFGALGTHRPEALHKAIEFNVLAPLVGMLDKGTEREKDLVASLLLVMMTANEKTWLAAKSNKALTSSSPTKWPLLATCLSFDGTHQELSDFMMTRSQGK